VNVVENGSTEPEHEQFFFRKFLTATGSGIVPHPPKILSAASAFGGRVLMVAGVACAAGFFCRTSACRQLLLDRLLGERLPVVEGRPSYTALKSTPSGLPTP